MIQMKRILKLSLLVLILVLGIISIKLEFGPYNIEFYDGFKYLPVILLMTISIISFIIERNRYLYNKNLKAFIFTFLSSVFIVVIFSRFVQRSIIEKEPILLKVTNVQGAAHLITFEFRKGNDFKLIEYGGAEKTIYYGKYAQSGNVINIQSSNYDGYAKQLPEIGLIKNDTVFWKGFDTMVVEK
jgi:hypothetical protein